MMHSYIEGFMAELVFLNHWMNGLNELFCIGIMDGTSVVQLSWQYVHYCCQPVSWPSDGDTETRPI